MKSKILPLLLAAAVGLSSCTTTSTTVDPKDLIAPAIQTAAIIVILKEKDPDDRRALALKLDRVADGLLLLSAGEISGPDLAAVVLANADESEYWVPLSLLIESTFTGNVEIGIPQAEVINKIATGLKSVATPYSA